MEIFPSSALAFALLFVTTVYADTPDISTGGNSSIGAPSTNDPIDSSNGQKPGTAAPGTDITDTSAPNPAASPTSSL